MQIHSLGRKASDRPRAKVGFGLCIPLNELQYGVTARGSSEYTIVCPAMMIIQTV